jgi:histidinol-phosphate phosphatase family protein
MNRAVFLDRDGTINEHTTGYVTSWKMFRFLPDSLEGLKKLAKSEHKIIVVTNQSAIARGLMSREDLEDIHSRMLAAVEEAGGRIDAVYVCAHHPEEKCICRKPLTGLIDLAAVTYDLDLEESWMVGDNTKDVQTGKKAGCKTILVATGYGGKDGLHNVEPDYRAKTLKDAVKLIIGSL